MTKILDFHFNSNNYGEHTITVETESLYRSEKTTLREKQEVTINVPRIVEDQENLRKLLNGLGNMLSSIACHLYRVEIEPKKKG